jgi:shikimate kinase
VAECSKVIITGFSGAGKTSLLKAIKASASLPWEHFDDLDQLIFAKHGKHDPHLSALIENQGWEKFRLWERQILDAWLKEDGHGVLALGGGALSPIVWELYGKSRKIKFCHLDISFAEAWERLKNDEVQPRPLVALGRPELEKIYLKRREIFLQIPWSLDAHLALKDLTKQFWEEL